MLDRRTGLPSNETYALYVDRDGALWSMGPSHIVRVAEGSGVGVFGAQSGYPPGGCESLASFRDSLFVASHRDILRLSPDPDAAGAGKFLAVGSADSRLYGLTAVAGGIAMGQTRGIGMLVPGGDKDAGSHR